MSVLKKIVIFSQLKLQIERCMVFNWPADNEVTFSQDLTGTLSYNQKIYIITE